MKVKIAALNNTFSIVLFTDISPSGKISRQDIVIMECSNGVTTNGLGSRAFLTNLAVSRYIKYDEVVSTSKITGATRLTEVIEGDSIEIEYIPKEYGMGSIQHLYYFPQEINTVRSNTIHYGDGEHASLYGILDHMYDHEENSLMLWGNGILIEPVDIDIIDVELDE